MKLRSAFVRFSGAARRPPPASPVRDRPYFFVHVMKTAGMTLNNHIKANFDPHEVYPRPGPEAGADYMLIERLEHATAEYGDEISVWGGHFPWFVTSFIPRAVTITLVRHPVDRVVSLLEQRRRNRFPDASRLEELYERPEIFVREIENHQTKVFSLGPDDCVRSWVDPVPMDDCRLVTAKKALESVDVLGCQERFKDFLAQLRDEWGWTIGPVENVNVGERSSASAAFRRRIETDSALDMELYEHARSILS